MEELTTTARNTRAAIFGLLIGVIYIIISTIGYKHVGDQVLFQTIKASGYLIFLLLLSVSCFLIKKANGGFLEFKQAFGAVFIMILISGTLYFVHRMIYIEYIDPEFGNKIKAAKLTMMEQTHVSPDIIKKTAADFDKQIAESKVFNLGNNLLAFFQMIVLDCLPGLLISFFIKKSRPII